MSTAQEYNKNLYIDSIDNQDTDKYSVDSDLVYLQISIAQSEVQSITTLQQNNLYTVFLIFTNQTLKIYSSISDTDFFDFSVQLYTKDSNYISEAITTFFYRAEKLELLCKQFEIETVFGF